LRHEYDMLKRIYHGYPKGYKINGIPKVGFDWRDSISRPIAPISSVEVIPLPRSRRQGVNIFFFLHFKATYICSTWSSGIVSIGAYKCWYGQWVDFSAITVSIWFGSSNWRACVGHRVARFFLVEHTKTGGKSIHWTENEQFYILLVCMYIHICMYILAMKNPHGHKNAEWH
jgi:hypothetical protein